MEVRGRRECRDCGGQWTYYETGSVACPDCGSLRSVGVGDRELHTDAPAELDLAPYAGAVADDEVASVTGEIQSACRAYARKRGFVNAGELRPPDDRFLLAHELVGALDVYGRLRDPGDAERRYLLALVRAATDCEGEEGGGAPGAARPAPEAVPASMHGARGLAYAEALGAFRRDAARWLDREPDPEGRKALGTLEEHRKRVAALQGDVEPAAVERLVTAAREVTRYLREDDEGALAEARERLRGLDGTL